MTEADWLKITVPCIVTLLAGGLAGAVLNNYLSSRKTRVQPIGYKESVQRVFRHTGETGALRAELLVEYDSMRWTFDNLFIANIDIVNRGSVDSKEFAFGLTLDKDDKAIHWEYSSMDRYHVLQVLKAPTPSNRLREIDLVASPFNRTDSYSIKLYVVVPSGKSKPGPIEPGSRESVRFVDTPSLPEMISLLGKVTVASVNVVPGGEVISAFRTMMRILRKQKK